jgi:hypothetical protein
MPTPTSSIPRGTSMAAMKTRRFRTLSLDGVPGDILAVSLALLRSLVVPVILCFSATGGEPHDECEKDLALLTKKWEIVGMKFAKLEMALITAYFFAYFEFELAHADGSLDTRPPPPVGRNWNQAQKPDIPVYLRYKPRVQ